MLERCEAIENKAEKTHESICNVMSCQIVNGSNDIRNVLYTKFNNISYILCP